MPEFINPNNHAVHLPGPDGRTIRVNSKQRIVLAEFFAKYCARGFIRQVDSLPVPAVAAPQSVQGRVQLNRSTSLKKAIHVTAQRRISNPSLEEAARRRKEEVARARKIAAQTKIKNPGQTQIQRRPVVGRAVNVDATQLLHSNLAKDNYPISNNIGIGILSYNRASTLRRLVDSILRTTDLRQTTIFISDDASDTPDMRAALDEFAANNNLVVLRNSTRLGVAGNSNRLLRCLSRFDYGMILNDDVEVLAPGWDRFYFEAMNKTGLHHFIYRQPGVYGADGGSVTSKNGVTLNVVQERPHGAVLAFTNTMLNSVGFFNEAYGLYGMEHVDWSQKAWELGLQERGFFDADGSNRYFMLHTDGSAVGNRQELLRGARQVFANRVVQRCSPSAASEVPALNYVVPFRNVQRDNSIRTVVNNIRAQRFPVIDIIVVEQDVSTMVDVGRYQPISYYLVTGGGNHLFNKAKAFNLGVSKASTPFVVLHDADILAQGHYTRTIYETLAQAEACHLGKAVVYANEASTLAINSSGTIDDSVKCERVVGYFEGGSIACRTSTFWCAGGFNEDFWGYGVEDCDFYARLSQSSKWTENRVFDFLHLWHTRVPGWIEHHRVNRALGSKLEAQPMSDRRAAQYRQLAAAGYGQYVDRARGV